MTRSTKDIIAGIAVVLMGCVAIASCGCAPTPAPRPATQPAAFHRNFLRGELTPCGLVWSGDTIFDQMAWQREAESRFGAGKVFLFFAHGGDDGRTWYFTPQPGCGLHFDAEAVGQILSDLHPSQAVVLIACNPGHYSMHVARANIWYAKRNVYCRPNVPMAIGGADSIWEFTNQ